MTPLPRSNLFSQPVEGGVAPRVLPRSNLFSGVQEEASTTLFTPQLSPFDAGVHQALGMGASGAVASWIASGGQLDDIEGLVNYRDEQEELASSAKIDNFGDKLEMAGGQIAAGAVPVLAAMGLAPILGVAAGTGALVTGTLAGILSSVGEVDQKARALDPEYEADWKTLAAGVPAGALSAVPLKRFLPAIKPMSELLEEVGQATLGQSALVRGAKEVAKTAALSGATEAVQDAGTSVAAHALTDTVIDKTKARAIGMAAIEEFAIGSIFGGVGGVGAAYSQNIAEKQAAFDAEQVKKFEGKKPLMPLQDHTGELDPSAIVAPVEGAVKSPGTWNLNATQWFGKSTDRLRKAFPKNKYLQTFVQQFHDDPLNPQMGINTVNEDGVVTKGNFSKILAPVFEATKFEVEEAGTRRAGGKMDLSNPIDKALQWFYGKDQAVASEYNRVGRGKVDMSSPQWNSDTYLPNNRRVSWDNIVADPDKARQTLAEKMKVVGNTEEEILRAIKSLDTAMKEHIEKGNQLFDGWELDEDAVASMHKIVANENNKDVAKRMNTFINVYKKKNSSLARSPLNLKRAVSAAPQTFWEAYVDKNVSLQDAIQVDAKIKAEHLAYADKFGFNNEVAIELLGKAVIESYEPGQTRMTVADLDRAMDILRLQQRLPTKRLTPEMRRVMLSVKSYTGMTILGNSALMSIPETILTAYKNGIKGWAVGTYRGIRDMKPEAQREALATMEDVGHGYREATNMAASMIGETVNDMPKWETFLIQKLTGLPQLQFYLGLVNLRAADFGLRRKIDQLSDPQTSQAARNSIKRQLYQLGVKPEDALRWKQSGYKKDTPFYQDTYLPKLYRDLRTTIVEPHPVDKPAWMSNESFWLLAQLKSFVFTFQNLVLNDSFKKNRMSGPGANRELVMRQAPYLSAYILGQAGIMMLKELMSKGETDAEELPDKVIRSIGQQGVLSLAGDLYYSASGRTGVAEGVVPAAGLISRMVKGNIKLVEDILAGNVSPEQAVYDVVSVNAPATLANPLIGAMYREAFGAER